MNFIVDKQKYQRYILVKGFDEETGYSDRAMIAKNKYCHTVAIQKAKKEMMIRFKCLQDLHLVEDANENRGEGEVCVKGVRHAV